MTDTHPAYAVLCWADETNVYVKCPCSAGGDPYIMSYPASAGGFQKALDFMRSSAAKDKKPFVLPRINSRILPVSGVTTAQRTLAWDALKKVGLV